MSEFAEQQKITETQLFTCLMNFFDHMSYLQLVSCKNSLLFTKISQLDCKSLSPYLRRKLCC